MKLDDLLQYVVKVLIEPVELSLGIVLIARYVVSPAIRKLWKGVRGYQATADMQNTRGLEDSSAGKHERPGVELAKTQAYVLRHEGHAVKVIASELDVKGRYTDGSNWQTTRVQKHLHLHGPEPLL